MFVYQTKVDSKDALVLVAETQDAGKQLPVIGEEVLVVYESGGKLVSASGTVKADGTFEAADEG